MSDRQALTEIGPYRIEARLGTGGMGEVYRAYDSRLDRSVAVKLIRSDASADDGVARERFRREARAAARLSHPAVVQIHDIVESGEGDAIVMELVEGEPLSQRIARGPLPIDECVRLAREIAEGLAAAHTRKILHRDLKAENVMVTADGHAKILDFGLAKQIGGEESLTRTDAVIGTFRCMSPEQARGLELDHRSDLFSFGVLLYEMLTGRSPFRGENAPDTLSRVCTARQRPVREMRADAPQELVSLVDRLLEKDPALRPRSAQTVLWELEEALRGVAVTETAGQETQSDLTGSGGGPPPRETGPVPEVRRSRLRPVLWILPVAILAILAALVTVYFLVHRRAKPIYVAVPKPELATGEHAAGVPVLAASLRSSLLSGLLSFDGVLPLAADQVDPVGGSPRDLARATAADEVVTSQLSCDVRGCQVSLHRLRGQDGAVLWTRTFAVPLEQPYLLAESVRGYLQQAYSGRRFNSGAARIEVRPADYAEYLRLSESFDTRREAEYPIAVILERLDGIRRSSPRFLEAYIFEAYLLKQRFRSGRDARDLERAYAALDRAHELASDDPRPFQTTFEVAFLGEDLDRAEKSLQALERLQPGDARLVAQRARLLVRRGDPREALALMRQAVAASPSWKHLFWLSDMELKQGEVAAARGHLQELLRLSPGNLPGQSLLAQLELENGDPQKAASLYSDLARRSPQVTYLSNLGNAQLLLGDFAQAEQSFRLALEKQPKNEFVALNLADACFLSGHRREAAEFYLSTLRLAADDPTAGASWQIASTRAQALAHLGRTEEAIAAAQDALRLASENPAQVAYEVSLVYAVLGDKASAVFNAKRALAQGYAPRWFRYPWFDSVRASSDLQGLLPQTEPPVAGKQD